MGTAARWVAWHSMTTHSAEWISPRSFHLLYNPWPVHQPSSRDHGVIFFSTNPAPGHDLVMIVWCCFPPIPADSLCYKTVGFLTFPISWLPLRSTVSGFHRVFTRSGSFGLQSGVRYLLGWVYCSGTGVLWLDGSSSRVVQIGVTPWTGVRPIIRGR